MFAFRFYWPFSVFWKSEDANEYREGGREGREADGREECSVQCAACSIQYKECSMQFAVCSSQYAA